MAVDFEATFAALKAVLAKHKRRLTVKADSPELFSLSTKSPSPYPQHKGEPMFFGSVRLGKAYVSFHLMPLYMNPVVQKALSPGLKKRMQGKSCLNFRSVPDAGTLDDLKRLTEVAIRNWAERKLL